MSDLKLALCGAYPGLDPIRLLDYPFSDFISLTRQHLDRNRRTRQQSAAAGPYLPADGKEKTIYRPADDSWF